MAAPRRFGHQRVRRHRRINDGPAPRSKKRGGAPPKLVTAPKTPLSPGQRTYIAIDVPTPVATVHAEEELAADPSGGLVCNSPVAECR